MTISLTHEDLGTGELPVVQPAEHRLHTVSDGKAFALQRPHLQEDGLQFCLSNAWMAVRVWP